MGLKRPLARGHEFSAGADVLFVESPESTEEMKIIGNELGHAPLLANMVEGGRTPLLSRAELADMGFNFVIYPVAAMSVAAAGLSRAYRELLQGDVDAERVDFAAFKPSRGLSERLIRNAKRAVRQIRVLPKTTESVPETPVGP